MTELAKGFRQLSAAEALRALYIDFEGEKDKPPVLLGTLRRGARGSDPFVHQVVVDPEFEAAGPHSQTLVATIENLVRRAERGDRRIVAWSEHELQIVRRLGRERPELVACFESRYANARLVARRWRNRCHGGDTPAEGNLAAYLDLIDYDVPSGAGPGQTGTTIRALRPTVRAARRLTQRQEQRWAQLLAHNQHDCAGMRAVCLRATKELDESYAA